MPFEGFATIEGRHLVLAYAAVFSIQGGYFGWILMKLRKVRASDRKTAKRS